MTIYNTIQVLLSLYTFYNLLPILIRGEGKLNYFGINTNNEDLKPYYDLHFYSKYLDFLDTIWIILGNKKEQLTFLHVSHHATIFPANGIYSHYNLYGVNCFQALLNSFVHFIMYSYYLLSSCIDDKKKTK
jgi:hypothetical protein